MENMSSGVKREVMPKHVVHYRKHAFGVNRFIRHDRNYIINELMQRSTHYCKRKEWKEKSV